jgi:Ca2+-binding EF-hand superfamily protein
MKRLIIIGLLASAAWATDFSHMNTDEMMNMRGTVPVDDRPSFQQEMQKRMQSMSPEERQKYKGMRGQGQRMGQGRGMGIGQNCMNNQPTFAQYDINNDGAITQKELEEARAKRMSQKAKEGKMLRNAGNAPAFADMDKNKDGSLNQEEFRLHQTEQMNKCYKRNCPTGNCPSKGKGQGMMRNAGNTPEFADIDTNNDGVISKEEFRLHQTQRMKNKGNCTSVNCP